MHGDGGLAASPSALLLGLPTAPGFPEPEEELSAFALVCCILLACKAHICI